MKKVILDLCGGTGSWARPWAEAGYEVVTITLPDYDVTHYEFRSDGTMWFLPTKGLVKSIKIKDIYGILAAPPCTMFSFARTNAKKPRDLKEGMECVRACLDIIWGCRERTKLAFWALENPMGYLRQFLGNPLWSFDPSQFHADYNKTTDVWGYFKPPRRSKRTRYSSTDDNTRKLPEIPAEYKKDYKMSNLQIRRSITPAGFAQAFYEANK